MTNFTSFKWIAALIFFLLLAGCSPSQPSITATPLDDAPTPTLQAEEATPQPTPTEVPVFIAEVNGEGIAQSSYEASMAQFEIVQNETGDLLAPGEDAQTRVIDSLINRLLLAQAAREAGFVLTDDIVAERLTRLIEQAGGQEALAAWQQANGYSAENFLEELALEIEATWQRQQIAESLPSTAPQIKARQVQFYDAYLAARAYNQLLQGASFDTIVANNDPFNYGYLDWFPRGILIFSEIEDSVFALQPGEFSEVIETEIGFLILEVLEADPDRPLTSDARLTLQIKAVEIWLAEQRLENQIVIYAP